MNRTRVTKSKGEKTAPACKCTIPKGGIWIGARKYTPGMFSDAETARRYVDSIPELMRYFPDLDISLKKKSQMVIVDAPEVKE